MSEKVACWQYFLGIVSLINLAALAYSAKVLRAKLPGMPEEAHGHRKLQWILSAGYVAGCAFRSFFPVFDIERVCLIDSFASSVIVGRSVATVAELCFAGQWALLLWEVAKARKDKWSKGCARWVVPMIALAEVFSWYSVLTTANIGHVVEESLWGAAAALVSGCFVRLARPSQGSLRTWLVGLSVAGMAYVAYMFLVDVPMYWARWVSDEAAGKLYLTVGQGWLDAASRWHVSTSWSIWHTEVIWMSLYFSVAVWMSIGMAHLPKFEKRQKKAGSISWRTGP